MVEVAFLTAPDGLTAADVRLNGAWTWVILASGVVIIVCGGLLL